MRFVSCLPDALYKSSGLSETYQTQLDLESFTVKDQGYCRFIAELYQSYSYKRLHAEIHTSNLAFRTEVLHYYDACNSVNNVGVQSVLVCLKSGLLHQSLLFSHTENGLRVVYETNRENDRPWVEQVDLAGRDIEARSLMGSKAVNFFLGSAGSNNYGHWLVDDLPRARAYAALRDEAAGRPIRIWINSDSMIMDHVRSESLHQICAGLGDVEVRLLRPGRVYAFSNLYYATPISYHPVLKCPEALRFLNERLQPDQPAASRIFITRRDHGKRSLVNLAAIQALLEARGFTTVDVEAMSFAEQVRTFSGAKVIVGCMGAAMTNCLFAREGTLTIYLGPEGWLEPFYWDLAAVRSHRYVACFGPTNSGNLPAHLSSYVIDPAMLQDVLDKVAPG